MGARSGSTKTPLRGGVAAWYPGSVKPLSAITVWLSVASASVAACGGGGQGGQVAEPVVVTAPDDFVLRDVRKDAARQLACQAPNVGVFRGAWAGSAGNVTAYGCGYEINYYLRCVTSHQCSFSATD
jgi:hypothetical protein